MFKVEVLLDSVNPNGDRLTSLAVTFNRSMLAEFNTIRAFSRNAASSRAIPVSRMLKEVNENPYLPLRYGRNQSGMQAYEELSPEDARRAEAVILRMRDACAAGVAELAEIGLHKQDANRYIEPWSWTTDIVSATNFGNMLWQRYHEAAWHPFQKTAQLIYDALEGSKPNPLPWGRWHMPLLRPEDCAEGLTDQELVQISIARCARVSYLTHKGIRDTQEDLRLFQKLYTAEPPHYSPFEHVAQAGDMIRGEGGGWYTPKSNFTGWIQYRKFMPNENRTDYPRKEPAATA